MHHKRFCIIDESDAYGLQGMLVCYGEAEPRERRFETNFASLPSLPKAKRQTFADIFFLYLEQLWIQAIVCKRIGFSHQFFLVQINSTSYAVLEPNLIGIESGFYVRRL